MEHHTSFLGDLGIVLLVASAASLVFRLLRLPTLLGYLVAGLAVGPSLPLPIFADLERIEALAEFGVVLVMFSVGLEFSLRRLVSVLPTSGVTALVQMSGLASCGYLAGRALDLTEVESIFLGAALAISSTMVVARVFGSQKVEAGLRELVYGVLVVQDVVVVGLIAVLTAVASGSGVSTSEVFGVVGTLLAVLTGMVTIGLLVVPRLVRVIVRIGSAEVLVVTGLGICFGFSILAQALGYSVALGAFLAGMLVAESGKSRRIEILVQPVRDLFAAIFFVSIGMLVDPRAAIANGHIALMIAGLVIVAQFTTVTIASVLAGNGLRTSTRAGVYLGQIGEFSFIMVTIGTAAGVVEPTLLSIVVTVAAITSFTTPMVGRVSENIAAFIDRKLPRRLQNLLSLYESWLQNIRTMQPGQQRSRLKRLGTVVGIDAIALVSLAIGTSLFHTRLARAFTGLGLSESFAEGMIVAGAIVAAIPLMLGLVRSSKALAQLVAREILPRRDENAPDLADAPRRVLTVALQLAVVLTVGAPVVAVTQPFLPSGMGVGALALIVAILTVVFWRTARNLEGHVRAGAEVLVELLANQGAEESGVHDIEEVLPGLGAIASVRIEAEAPVCGKTLAELNLRTHTGATVLAIRRGEEGERVLTPSGHDVIEPGDVLALSGTDDALKAARELLTGEPAPEPTAA